VLKIMISGASAPLGSDGFDIEADPTTIRGLVINGFKEDVSGNSGQAIGFFNLAVNTDNVVEGNFIGNTIGGATPAARKLIAGNGEQEVEISASDANTVQGNLIRTKTGTTDLGNVQDGVRMTSSSRNIVTDNVVAFNGHATHTDSGVEVLKSGTAKPLGNRLLTSPSSLTRIWA